MSMVAGVMKRFAIRPPEPDEQLLEELRAFTRKWIRDHLKPLPPDSDTSVNNWLDHTNYPLWRKEELRAEWERVHNVWDKKWREVSSFMKDETYAEWKFNRGINSRSDGFKCAVGPIFKLIEEQLYQDPSFIKHVPVADRPMYIKSRLYRYGAKYYASDYTAFESLFVAKLMHAVEFELYEYMTQYVPGGPEWFALIREVLGGENWCKYRDFWVSLTATRMSGEMCTSLGNGFSNLMFMLFTCAKKGCTDVVGVVEGDDGLFALNGPAPTKDDFAKLGLVIKLEEHLELNTASFCGLVFDEEDCINVTDPREVLASFGWASARYASSGRKTLAALLRCRALSLAHQYPGCPIISALAQYGLRITREIPRMRMYKVVNSRKAMSGWERDQLISALRDESGIVVKKPPLRTRLLVERLYGISVESQLSIERYLDAKDDWFPLELDALVSTVHPSWRDYWTSYVQGNTTGDLRRPCLRVASRCVKLPCKIVRGWFVSPDLKKKHKLPPNPRACYDWGGRFCTV
jgi:hypothetical protein